MVIPAGSRLGPYEILAPLGAGGMGEVYRARDTRLARNVAVKVVHPRLAADPERVSRFEREARAAAQLDHPNILVVHDVGMHEGSPFIVSQLLEGESLREKLGSGVPVARAIDYAIQIAQGLAAAHEKGIVHRDIKPENVFVTKDGDLKILDFGVAKLLPAIDSTIDTEKSTETETRPRTAIGTVAYMSPEQARGENVDFRTDQFSLGVVLYEMVTAKRPFTGTSTAEILAAIIRDDPEPLTNRDPALPKLLDWVVERCLSKDPEERYSSTRDLVKELRSLRQHLSQTSAAKGSPVAAASGRDLRKTVRTLAVIAGVAVLAAVLFAIRLGRRGAPSVSPVRLSLSFPLDAEPQNSGNFNPLALSPNGKTLVYAGRRLFVRSLERETTEPIAGTDGAVSPFFSPDGRWLGFFADGKLQKMRLEGGPPITLCRIEEPGRGSYGAASWGEDGTIVFMASYFQGLQRIDASGGVPRPVTTVDPSSLESHVFPQILPDGEHVLFEIDRVAPNSVPRAAVVSLRTGAQHVLAEDAAYPRYVPDHFILFTRAGSLHAAPFDAKKLEISGLAVPVLEDVLTNRRFTNAAHLAFSSDGTLVYRAKGQFRRSLVWVDRTGATEPLSFPPVQYSEVHLSPDAAHWAALTVENDESIRLVIGDLGRGTVARPALEGFFQHLAWTPDGKRIAIDFCLTAQDLGRLSWFSVDGSSPLEPLLGRKERQHETPTSFSPDGESLLFDVVSLANSGRSDTGSDIYVLPLRGAREAVPFLRTRFEEQSARFSPDGRWVAYQSTESGRFEIFVRPFPGPGPKYQISADGGTMARWARNGREIFFRKGDRMMAVGVEPMPTFTAGRPRLLFEGPFLDSYDVDPDGKRFLMVRKDPAESGAPRVNVVLNWLQDLRSRVPGR